MPAIIEHDAKAQQFRTVVDGHQAELNYRLRGTVMSITHTGVPEEISGRGIAADLMKAALAHAESAGWTIVPACSYAAGFMTRHPEYSHLRQYR
jgi:predicted GNAT family acetyltransferase